VEYSFGMSAGRREEIEEAYQPVEAPEVWPLLGLLFFALALVSKPLVRLLPAELRPYPLGVLLPVAVSLGSALLGLLCSWVGLRRGRGGALARAGLLFNGAVLALSALAVAALVWIVRR
jgi:hypothetical protein